MKGDSMERLDNTATNIFDDAQWGRDIQKAVMMKEVKMSGKKQNQGSSQALEGVVLTSEANKSTKQSPLSDDAEHRLIGYIVANTEKIRQVQQDVITCNHKVDTLEQKVDYNHQETILRFEQMDQKFEQIDLKFETKLGQLDQKFETKIEQLDQKIDSFQAENRSEFQRLDQKIDGFQAENRSEFRRLDQKIDSFQAENCSEFRRVEHKFDGQLIGVKNEIQSTKRWVQSLMILILGSIIKSFF